MRGSKKGNTTKPNLTPYAISLKRKKKKNVINYSLRNPSPSYRLTGVAHPMPRPMVLPLGVVSVKLCFGVRLPVDTTETLLLFFSPTGVGVVFAVSLALALELSRSSELIGDKATPFVGEDCLIGDIDALASSQMVIPLELVARLCLGVLGVDRGLAM
jgi:hypothetical protein